MNQKVNKKINDLYYTKSSNQKKLQKINENKQLQTCPSDIRKLAQRQMEEYMMSDISINNSKQDKTEIRPQSARPPQKNLNTQEIIKIDKDFMDSVQFLVSQTPRPYSDSIVGQINKNIKIRHEQNDWKIVDQYKLDILKQKEKKDEKEENEKFIQKICKSLHKFKYPNANSFKKFSDWKIQTLFPQIFHVKAFKLFKITYNSKPKIISNQKNTQLNEKISRQMLIDNKRKKNNSVKKHCHDVQIKNDIKYVNQDKENKKINNLLEQNDYLLQNLQQGQNAIISKQNSQKLLNQQKSNESINQFKNGQNLDENEQIQIQKDNLKIDQNHVNKRKNSRNSRQSVQLQIGLNMQENDKVLEKNGQSKEKIGQVDEKEDLIDEKKYQGDKKESQILIENCQIYEKKQQIEEKMESFEEKEEHKQQYDEIYQKGDQSKNDFKYKLNEQNDKNQEIKSIIDEVISSTIQVQQNRIIFSNLEKKLFTGIQKETEQLFKRDNLSYQNIQTNLQNKDLENMWILNLTYQSSINALLLHNFPNSESDQNSEKTEKADKNQFKRENFSKRPQLPSKDVEARMNINKYKSEQQDQSQETQYKKTSSQEHKEKKQPISGLIDDIANIQVKMGTQLGEGAYGVVYKGLIPKTGKFVAIKQLKLNKPLSKDNQQPIQEIDLLQKFQHINIVRYLGCRQDGDTIQIFMEYMTGGSISQMMKQYGKFSEKVIKKFVAQLIEGLEYLHTQGVVHRDLKGGNILSDGQGNVKLSDFGAARHIENLPLLNSSATDMCKSMKGSPFWMAPELLNQEGHGRKSDIWSLGCTIIEMATADHPWKDCKSMTQLIIQVMNEKCPPIPTHLSKECQDFIKQCCTFDKKARPNTAQLKLHPFLNQIN